MACPECAALVPNVFRSADDLVHAVQVAAQECDRGVLRRLAAPQRSVHEQEALDSMYAARALPAALDYRFECTLCGERFRLEADPAHGTGRWTRETPGGEP